jgi:8-oxo-dGTP diphosphatase
MNQGIYKVGAIILNDKKELLVVRKHYKDRLDYIIPGGKQEKGENDRQTLLRELQEELAIHVTIYEYFGKYEEVAIFENIPIVISVYQVKIEGEPQAHSEIKDLVWIDRNYHTKGYILGTVLSKHVIPSLIERGEM